MKKELIGVALATALTGCNAMPPPEEKVINLQPHINNTLMLENKLNIDSTDVNVNGTAYNYRDNLFNSYYLTVSHCVSGVGDTVDLIHKKDTLKAVVVYDDKYNDIAILKGKKDKHKSKIKLGNPEDLLKGEDLYRVGYPMGMGRAVRKTNLSNMGKFGDTRVLINNGTAIGGESGSPIFAVRDDKPYLVGILSATNKGIDVNVGISSDVFKRYLK